MSWNIAFKQLGKAAAAAFATAESDKNIGWGYQTEAQKAFALAAIEATPGTHVDGYVAGHNNSDGMGGNISVSLTGITQEEVAGSSADAPLATSTTSMEDTQALSLDEEDPPAGGTAVDTPLVGGGGESDGGGASADFGGDGKPEDSGSDSGSSDAGAGEPGGATGNE